MGLNFKYHASAIYRLVGLWLALLAINPSFGIYTPLTDKEHEKAIEAYRASGDTDTAPLTTILDDLNEIKRLDIKPRIRIIRFLGSQFKVANDIEKIIGKLQELITGIVDLASKSDDGGVAESKGGGADGPSPDASIGGASGPRLGALATAYKEAGGRTMFDWYLRSIRDRCNVFPSIGFYDTSDVTRYNMRAELATICGDMDLFQRSAPEQVRNQVMEIGRDNFIFYINIFGPFERPLPHNTPNNVVFHPVVGNWLGNYLTSDFNVNIQAGLFGSNGVTNAGIPAYAIDSGSIPFDSLQPIQVHYHTAYSPNNAQFKLVGGRNIVSFWLVGKHTGHAIVTLNLIINSDSSGLGAKLIRDLERSNDLATLIRSFDLSAERPILPKPEAEAEDAQAVWNFTDVLKDMLAA